MEQTLLLNSVRWKHFDPIDTIYYLDTSRRPAAVLPLTSTKRPTCRLRGGLGTARRWLSAAAAILYVASWAKRAEMKNGIIICGTFGTVGNLWLVRSAAAAAQPSLRRSARWPSSLEHGVHDETIEQRCHQQPFVTLCTLLHFHQLLSDSSVDFKKIQLIIYCAT